MPAGRAELCPIDLVNEIVAKKLMNRMAEQSRWSRYLLCAGVVWTCGLGLVGCESTGTTAKPPGETSAPVGATDAASAEVDAAVAAAREQAEAANRELERDRQTLQYAAWQHVKAIVEMWRQMPAEYFPGIARLVEQTDALAAEIESDETIRVGAIDPVALTSTNPAFWRAMMETTPEDPVVALYQQMLWAARGYFDRATWLIDLQIYGPTLPMPVHRLTYGMGEEMGRVRRRQLQRRNALLANLPPEEIMGAVRAAQSFRPDDLDWTVTGLMLRLRAGGVDLERMDEQAALVDGLMANMIEDWKVVARQSPLTAARFHPEAEVRRAAAGVDKILGQLGESRGAYGERDLNRLADALAEAGLYAEALQTTRRATGMRGFALPGALEQWWRWLPNLIGQEETDQLRQAAQDGSLRPVAFFNVGNGPDGVAVLPLHPIIADRTVRRLQEAERRLSESDPSPQETAYALVTKAETLGHLGRWDEAEAALDALPTEIADAGAPTRVWLALWSGRVDDIDARVAALEPGLALTAPALPALAAAAQGRWNDGATIFVTAAEAEENETEYRAYYALMGAAFNRLGGDDVRADALIERARELAQGHDWVSLLARGMAGETSREPVGDNISEITEAGRVCEQRFYRAFQRGLDPERQRALLEGCVATGVVDFVEYTASLLRLRQLEPEVWDPTVAPPPEPEGDDGAPADEQDWIRGASPSWSIPS